MELIGSFNKLEYLHLNAPVFCLTTHSALNMGILELQNLEFLHIEFMRGKLKPAKTQHIDLTGFSEALT